MSPDKNKMAPVVLFTYNRPEHTRRTLESLANNHDAESSALFIFCDGLKSSSEEAQVNQVRKIVKSKDWCGTVHVVERDKNRGLANSVITGVTELCEKFGRVIVLEDDLILSPYFLRYMNNMLARYEDNNRVMQVSGYMFPAGIKCMEDTLFLPFITSWGWATWNRAWQYFDPDAKQYNTLASDPEKIYKFNLNDSYPYFPMLKNQVNGNLDSWAIRWYLSVFIKDGLALYPKQSLVNNIGFDGTGTHCNSSRQFSNKIKEMTCPVTTPNATSICSESFQIIQRFLSADTNSNNRSSISDKIINFIGRFKK